MDSPAVADWGGRELVQPGCCVSFAAQKLKPDTPSPTQPPPGPESTLYSFAPDVHRWSGSNGYASRYKAVLPATWLGKMNPTICSGAKSGDSRRTKYSWRLLVQWCCRLDPLYSR